MAYPDRITFPEKYVTSYGYFALELDLTKRFFARKTVNILEIVYSILAGHDIWRVSGSEKRGRTPPMTKRGQKSRCDYHHVYLTLCILR